MTTVKDYLASLIIGINQARALADIESVNLAKVYAQDSLLKHFPVPRFRAPEIELTIPIAIADLDEVIAQDYHPINHKKFNALAYQTIKEVTHVKAFDLKHSLALRRAISGHSKGLDHQLKAGSDKGETLHDFSRNISTHIINEMVSDSNNMAKSHAASQNSMRDTLIQVLVERLNPIIQDPEKTTDIKNGKIIVEASKLREIRSENLVQIKLKLNEEGMEWHTMEDEKGEKKSKLLPE